MLNLQSMAITKPPRPSNQTKTLTKTLSLLDSAASCRRAALPDLAPEMPAYTRRPVANRPGFDVQHFRRSNQSHHVYLRMSRVAWCVESVARGGGTRSRRHKSVCAHMTAPEVTQHQIPPASSCFLLRTRRPRPPIIWVRGSPAHGSRRRMKSLSAPVLKLSAAGSPLAGRRQVRSSGAET
jgi:hypothetical protein